jgi:hypothetical protein
VSAPVSTWRITVVEISADGSTRERFCGDCDAYLLAVAKTVSGGQLRLFTDHDGPINQRRTALKSLSTHIRATIGLGR